MGVSMRSIHLKQDGKFRTGIPEKEIAGLLRKRKDLLWLDLDGDNLEDVETLLRQTFGFHPLAIEDALQETHVPKVDDWGQYLYMVLHAADLHQQEDEVLQTLELDVFLGHNYLVTLHTETIPALDRLWEMCIHNEGRLRQGTDHLLYLLVDEIAEDYIKVMDRLDEKVEGLEDEIFNKASQYTLETLFTYKRSLLHVRRVLLPQREVMSKLARNDLSVIDAQDRIFFRDVYDHFVRLHEMSESLRDLATGALEIYLSTVNNRINEVVKTLTVVTTLFMPLTFLSGFFGMNFFGPTFPFTEWTSQAAFAATLAAMAALPVGMYLWFRRRL